MELFDNWARSNKIDNYYADVSKGNNSAATVGLNKNLAEIINDAVHFINKHKAPGTPKVSEYDMPNESGVRAGDRLLDSLEAAQKHFVQETAKETDNLRSAFIKVTDNLGKYSGDKALQDEAIKAGAKIHNSDLKTGYETMNEFANKVNKARLISSSDLTKIVAPAQEVVQVLNKVRTEFSIKLAGISAQAVRDLNPNRQNRNMVQEFETMAQSDKADVQKTLEQAKVQEAMRELQGGIMQAWDKPAQQQQKSQQQVHISR